MSQERAPKRTPARPCVVALLAWPLAMACGAPARDSSFILTVRDPQLAEAARAAGARLENATGMRIAFGDDGVPMGLAREVECGGHVEARACTYYRDRYVGAAGTLISAATGHAAAQRLEAAQPLTIVIEHQEDTPLLEAIILHELAHAAGVSDHVDPERGGGVLAPRVHAETLVTAADLDALCGVAPCRWFAPETE